jgi:hypothetical protein
VIEIEVKYKGGHSYQEKWELTQWYCPCCGKQFVYQEQGPGDYYVGSEMLCIICNGSFYMPSEPSKTEEKDLNYLDKQRLETIKQHRTKDAKL